jgi:hypothetical protein
MGLSEKGAKRLLETATSILSEEIEAAMHKSQQAVAAHKDEVRKAKDSVEPLRKMLQDERENREHDKAALALAEGRVKQLGDQLATSEQTVKQLSTRNLELERALAEATKGQPVVKQTTVPMPPRMAAQFGKAMQANAKAKAGK